MQTWVCAILFIIVGYLLAVLIGMIMDHGKVRDTNKLNRDNVIGLMDGITLVVSLVVQNNKTVICKQPIPTAEASKQIYNNLLSKYSESKIVGMVNQLLNYSNDKKYSDSEIKQFVIDIATSYVKIIGNYCPGFEPGPVIPTNTMQAPHNYNLGPAQYMARNGCGM